MNINNQIKNDFLEMFEESAKKDQALIQTLVEKNKSAFLATFEQQQDEISKDEHTQERIDEMKMTYKKSVIQIILSFVEVSKFNSKDTLDYANILEQVFNPAIFPIILWLQDKPESAKQLLENHQIKISPDFFDKFTHIFENHIVTRNRPLGVTVAEYIQDKKNNFFQYYTPLKLKQKLDNKLDTKPEQKKLKI